MTERETNEIVGDVARRYSAAKQRRAYLVARLTDVSKATEAFSKKIWMLANTKMSSTLTIPAPIVYLTREELQALFDEFAAIDAEIADLGKHLTDLGISL